MHTVFTRTRFTLSSALLLCLSFCAQAAPYYCMNTHQFVNPGDSVAQVKKACGEPESEQAMDLVDTQPQPVQQWFYHQSNKIKGLNVGGPSNIMVEFVNGKVTSIQADNEAFDSLNFCASRLSGSALGVKVGDTLDAVRGVCGNPTSSNVGTRKVSSEAKAGAVLIYSNGPYQPKTTMSFIEDKLTEIKVGP